MFDDLHTYRVSAFIFKVFHCLLPQFITNFFFIINFFTRTNTIHQLTHQACYDFFIPRVHLNFNKKMFCIIFAKPWQW